MRNLILRGRHSSHFYLVSTIAALVVILALSTDSFFTLRNLFDLLTSYSYLAILALGLVVVLIAGAIDISFTATAAVAQYISATYLIAHGGDWFIAFALAGVVGVALGAVNAVLVHYLRVSSIIISIAMLNVYYGLLIFVTHGDYLYALPDWFDQGFTAFRVHGGQGKTYGVTLPIAALLVVVVLTWLILKQSSIGRRLYALGSNREAAQRVGFNLLGLRVFALGYLGLLAGVASIVQAQLTQQVAPNSLVGRELDVLAAVVIGGAGLAGGVGSVGGTILGMALLAIIQNGLVLLGISSYWSELFVGAVIVASVCATATHGKALARRIVNHD